MGNSFYTSVERYGNNMLWRGYKNGVSFSKRVKYKPRLFLQTKDTDSEYKSLLGEVPLKEKVFDSMSDAKDFLERYSEVSGFNIYGNTRYVDQFIQEKYPDQIDFDMKLINVFSYDIEVDISSHPKYDENHKIKVRKKQE